MFKEPENGKKDINMERAEEALASSPDAIAVAFTSKASPAPGTAIESTSDTPRQVTPDELKNAVAVINQAMQQSNSSLQFSVDADSHTPIVRLVDTNTGELIRQIPSEETLAISRSLDEALQRQGLLCKQVA